MPKFKKDYPIYPNREKYEIAKKIHMERIMEKITNPEIIDRESTVEEIAEILKNNKIDQIIIAGEKQKNKEEQTLRLHPDLDSELALYLLNNFNKRKPEEMYNDGAVVSVINKNGAGKELIEDKKGVKIYLDTGDNWLKIEKDGETTTLYIDHHGTGQRDPTSGVKMTAEIMEKAGILKEKPEWLNKLIDFVNDVDNLTYLDKKDKKGNKTFTESYFRNEWPASLYALAEKKIPLNLLIELCEKGIIKDLTKPFTDEELNGEIGKIKIGEQTIKDLCIEQRKEMSTTLDVGIKNSIQHNKKEGINLEKTRLGKIIYQDYFKIKGKVNIIPDHLAFKATIAKGYDTYIAFNKQKDIFFINSKNPNLSNVVEELNKKYPGCATDIRGVMVYGKMVEGLNEEEFLNIIDPKILERKNKISKKEKQEAEVNVATPYISEPEIKSITPEKEDAEYEAEKAEIEKRRQEALKRLSFDELMSEFEHNNHRLIGIRNKIGNSTFRIIDVNEEEQEVIIDYIKPDGTHSNFGLKIGSEKTFKKYKEKYAEVEWSDKDIEAKYEIELAELDKKYNKNQEKNSEDNQSEENERNTEGLGWTKEKERELQAIKAEAAEADIKLAQLLDMINQLPDEEEKENKEPQKTEMTKDAEEQDKKAIEDPKTQINETEKNQTYKKIMVEDFSWSFPNYINKFGELKIGDKLSITVEEFTQKQEKRSILGRVFSSSTYKTIKLEKPFCELKITQEGSTKIYKLDNISQAINKTDEILSEYARKTASNLGEVTYIPYDYVRGSEKIENNILYYIRENILSEIKKDREEKPFLYFAVEKSNNSVIININKNENTEALDLRRLGRDWIGLERKFLIRTAENEGFFQYNIFGFIKIIKNIKEIQKEKGIAAGSDKAIYKIIGPNEEIIADNIQGYDEATKIYWEKTNEYKKVVEEEFNKLNNNKR